MIESLLPRTDEKRTNMSFLKRLFGGAKTQSSASPSQVTAQDAALASTGPKPVPASNTVADPKKPDIGSAVRKAVEAGDPSYIKQILKSGTVADTRELGEFLLNATYNGNQALVQILLAAQVDTEARDEYGLTPLLRAAHNGNVEITKMLVAAGADKQAKDREGETALTLAARYPKVLEVLLGDSMTEANRLVEALAASDLDGATKILTRPDSVAVLNLAVGIACLSKK
jgi:hypothetical protein